MLYGIVHLLPIVALTLSRDGSSGQDNGTDRLELLDAAAIRYEPGTSGNQSQSVAI